ncbi:hypothetical protein GCM10009853_014880 [Glycomyces scopariae]
MVPRSEDSKKALSPGPFVLCARGELEPPHPLKGTSTSTLLSGRWQTYISTIYFPETETFTLDFRDGTPALHYSAPAQTRETVIGAFLSYLAGDNRWKTAAEWKRDTHYELIQG